MPDLTIVGASARAAAQSAVRAGFRVFAADLFGDTDLPAAEHRRIEKFPGGILSALGSLPDSPWLFTGGVENFPALVARVAARRLLLGCVPATLRRVRTPGELAAVARECGFGFPETRTPWDASAGPAGRDSSAFAPGKWLRKPYRGSGGLTVDFCSPASSIRSPNCLPRRHYWQQFVPGVPVSASFLAGEAKCHWLGAAEQLVGPPWCARPFVYAGGIAPLALSPAQAAAWQRLGTALTQRFALRGLFGVDAIQAGDTLWVLEVNPRYTASMELFERSSALASASLIGWHVAAASGRACENWPPAALPIASQPAPHCYGKAIVFAAQACEVTASQLAAMQEQNSGSPWPVWADLPRVGAKFRAGEPIATVFASGTTVDATRAALGQRLAQARAAWGW